MASSLLVEQTRLEHVDIEQAIKSVIYEIKHKSKTQKHLVYQNHRINHHLQQIQQKSEHLLRTRYGQKLSDTSSDANQQPSYENNSDQIQNMKSQLTDTTIPKTISSFYSRLDEIREYHRKFNVKIESRNTAETNDEQSQRKIKQLLQQEVEGKVLFTDEELYGRYVDLNPHYNAYLDLIFEKQVAGSESTTESLDLPSTQAPVSIDYVEYLTGLASQFEKLSLDVKNNPKYKSYLEGLLSYFIDFMNRTQPLMDVNKMMTEVEQEFQNKWNDGEMTECWAFLKKLIMKNNGAKPADEAANNGNQHQGKKKRRGGKRKSQHNVEKLHSIALLEYKISKFINEWLVDVIQQTKVNVEKRSTRTWEENQAEHQRVEAQMDREDDEELKQQRAAAESDPMSKYASKKNNPLNLPIGPDGKPIPYWLYKWQGLGNEYICEICGNFSYWGHRDFEKHFQEWRHANGMKCLGIPNTRHFHHVTKIKDAQELWNSMQQQEQGQHWDNSEMEEVEDAEGNVYTKQTFIDLKKQGYIK